jgi:hypothetical protein
MGCVIEKSLEAEELVGSAEGIQCGQRRDRVGAR